jgi:hypothetical protein
MKKNPPSSRYISDVAGILTLHEGDKAIIVGGNVFASLTATSMTGFVRLAPRSVTSWLKGLLKRRQPKIFVALQNEFHLALPKHSKYQLALDSYLQWGYAQPGRCVLVTGYTANHKTSLQILVFDAGVLIDLAEKEMRADGATMDAEVAVSIVHQIKADYAGYTISVAAPLQKFPDYVDGIGYVGEQIFAKARFGEIQPFSEHVYSGIKIAGAVVTAGALLYAGMLGQGLVAYRKSVATYDATVADPVFRNPNGVGSGIIDRLQEQRTFLSRTVGETGQKRVASNSRELVAGIARLPGAKIISLSLNAPGFIKPGQDTHLPEIKIEVDVPASSEKAFDQGNQMLTVLADSTGLQNIHMASGQGGPGWRESQIKGHRIFLFEGGFHHG